MVLGGAGRSGDTTKCEGVHVRRIGSSTQSEKRQKRQYTSVLKSGKVAEGMSSGPDLPSLLLTGPPRHWC